MFKQEVSYISKIHEEKKINSKLVLIEDDNNPCTAVLQLLEKIGYTDDRIIRCSLLSDMYRLNEDELEIIIADLTLPDSNFHCTFERVFKKFPLIPIIVLTDTNEIDFAIKTIKQGAQDYLVKGNFDHKILYKAIQYAIERKKILDKVFIEKQNLKAIINNTSGIIWSIDKNYKIISANDAFWKRIYMMTGKTKSEVCRTDFDPKLYEVWVAYFDRALKGEAFKVIWTEIKNSITLYEEVSFNPIYDKYKNIIGACCFSIDITDHLIHIRLIERQNEQLKKIAWVQSHEVRSPLATIKGLVQLFNSDDITAEDNIVILDGIMQAANILDEVIKKTVAYTEKI